MAPMFVLGHLLLIFAAVYGRCGFPGRPKDGEVEVDWDAQYPVASYSCLSKKMESDSNRVCKNGKWTEAIPRCGKEIRLETDFAYRELVDQNLFSSKTIKSGESMRFTFPQQFVWRIYAWFSPTNDTRVTDDFLSTVKWSVHIDGPETARNKKIERGKNSGSSESMLFRTYWYVRDVCNSVSLTFRGLNELELHKVELYTFPDECDHPEEPMNGRVDWSVRQATYHCDEGFTMCPHLPARNCSFGQWDGEPPSCVKLDVPDLTDKYWIAISVLITLAVILLGCMGKMMDSRKRGVADTSATQLPAPDDVVGHDQAPPEPLYEEIEPKENSDLSEFQGYEIPNHLV